jgi:hypothetical protein
MTAMTTRLATVFVATIAIGGSTASAQRIGYAEPPDGDGYGDGYRDSHSAPRLVDGRIGLLLGGSDVGDADGFSTGVSAALGYRIGDITLRGLVDYYRVGDGTDEAEMRKGRATRVGGALRYSLANSGRTIGFVADTWLEAGVGLEHVAWRQGGVLDRTSGELAIGIDLSARSERRREVGYFMAFRSLIGEGPEMPGATIACGGPCSKPTTPPRTDISMFFELGVRWGR